MFYIMDNLYQSLSIIVFKSDFNIVYTLFNNIE